MYTNASSLSSSSSSAAAAAAAAQKPWVSLGFLNGFPPFFLVFGSLSYVPNTKICENTCHSIQLPQVWSPCSSASPRIQETEVI
jgi:hypothetical protein